MFSYISILNSEACGLSIAVCFLCYFPLKEVFDIGREIASSITEMNPGPVTLKMEEVYCPCFLLTKKRCMGYS